MLKAYQLAAVLCTLLSTVGMEGATLYSIANGVWGNTAVWSYTNGGASCGCFPATADNVNINHNITLDRHLTNVGSNTNGITGVLTINAGASLSGGNTYDIDIRSAGTLNLCGVLVAKNVIFSNGSHVNVCATGNITVNGNFENKNSSDNVVLDGTMTVNGSYTNGNGGVISGTGSVTITNGPVTNTGSTFGCEGVGCSVFPCSYSPGNCGGTPLPIELSSLSASCNASGTITLNWSTATEVNNDYFTVERSADARNFIPVARITGAGTSSTKTTYSWTDDELLQNGLVYYRLRQTDFDGNFSMSYPVSTRCEKEARSYFVYPNPATSYILISSSALNDQNYIRIFDAPGKELMSLKMTLENEQRIDVSHLANGVYVLLVGDMIQGQKEKLVINR